MNNREVYEYNLAAREGQDFRARKPWYARWWCRLRRGHSFGAPILLGDGSRMVMVCRSCRGRLIV